MHKPCLCTNWHFQGRTRITQPSTHAHGHHLCTNWCFQYTTPPCTNVYGPQSCAKWGGHALKNKSPLYICMDFGRVQTGAWAKITKVKGSKVQRLMHKKLTWHSVMYTTNAR